MTDQTAGRARVRPVHHPRALAPSNLVLTVILSVIGAIVGIQLLATIGITPSTSLLGAVVAMTLARIPLTMFRGYRSIHAQNLAQTSISSATFGAANCLFLPIGIPYLFGLPDMILPLLAGVSAAMLVDAWMLYRLFDTAAFPASRPWPLGVAAAEAIRAGDEGGRRALVLLGGLATGVAGAIFALPMSAFGIALIAGLGAMIAFAVGLLVSSYALAGTGIDIQAMLLPHGMMIGAGLVALIQVVRLLAARRETAVIADPAPNSQPIEASGSSAPADANIPHHRFGATARLGGTAYAVITIVLSIVTGIVTDMSPLMFVGFVLFATVSAFVHEILVGIAAMQAGYFPAFAIALITLFIGILIGFPPTALVVLSGFVAATGPAFADMGYDLKAGYLLRGEGADPAFELEGRRQQMVAGMIGFVVAIVVVLLSYQMFFDNGQTAPIDAAYVAAIKAGVSFESARNLLIWAIPGAIVQALGGSNRQLGILLATGLLLANSAAGWLVVVGLVVRMMIVRLRGPQVKDELEIFAGGAIGGDAIYSFGSGVVHTLIK